MQPLNAFLKVQGTCTEDQDVISDAVAIGASRAMFAPNTV